MKIFEDLFGTLKMGICLDTDRSGSPLVGDRTTLASSQNASSETLLGAPVIFFVGGPGSGKMAHAQNLADIHAGYRHINMIVVISEYIKENVLGPLDTVAPAAVVALLAREMQSTPRCRGFLVSGFPRNMDDLTMYIDKLIRPSGAILLEWDKRTLIRNIELGKIEGAVLMDWQDDESFDEADNESRMNQLVMDAARKELADFHSKVLPVCEHLDNLGLLFVVSGERSQEAVFKDVQRAHAKILHPNSTDPPSKISLGSYREYRKMVPFTAKLQLSKSTITPKTTTSLPPCLFVMGGPGSSKESLVIEMMYLYPGWEYLGVGSLLREHIRQWQDSPHTYTHLTHDKILMIKSLMLKGELIPQDLIVSLMETKLLEMGECEGIIIVGFPRDVIQAQTFEEKFGQVPPLLLVDCSELELGRSLGRRESRLDDTVPAAHRRLTIYRQITLPMLKAFDEKNRLRIIDGDADSEQVVRELKRGIYRETQILGKHIDRSQQSEDELNDNESDLLKEDQYNTVPNGNISNSKDTDLDAKSFSNDFSDEDMRETTEL